MNFRLSQLQTLCNVLCALCAIGNKNKVTFLGRTARKFITLFLVVDSVLQSEKIASLFSVHFSVRTFQRTVSSGFACPADCLRPLTKRLAHFWLVQKAQNAQKNQKNQRAAAKRRHKGRFIARPQLRTLSGRLFSPLASKCPTLHTARGALPKPHAHTNKKGYKQVAAEQKGATLVFLSLLRPPQSVTLSDSRTHNCQH